MEYGRAPRSHQVPRELKQNFKREPELIPTDTVDIGYIEDYYGKKSALEQRNSEQSAKAKAEMVRRIKRGLCIGICVTAVVIAFTGILCVCLYHFTCLFGNCPVGCIDCEYTADYWEQYTGKNYYRASQEHCGNDFYVELSNDSLTVSSSSSEGGSTEEMSTAAPLVKAFVEEDENGTQTALIQLFWYMERSVRNSETLKLVFSDDGEYYAGYGDFGNSFFRPKPTSGSTDKYTLLTTESNLYYFPYYLTRNANASICMFLDVKGTPVEIVVKSRFTEWTIFKTDNIKFYAYSGETPFEAMQQCNEKWRELYPSPEPSWLDDFIVGSLTPLEIKNASETDDILATHYILSAESIQISDGSISITGEDNISDYTNVYLTFNAKQYFQADDGYDLTTGKGFYPADEDDSYFLDYSSSDVESMMSTALSGQTTAGFLLLGGFLANQSAIDGNDTNPGWSCPEYLSCSSLSYDAKTTVCLADEFGEDVMFQSLNNYDTTRRDVLESAGLVIQTTASPGSTHLYRGNLDFTVDGLTTCFYELLNLHAVGVRAVTCNLCVGVIPPETEEFNTHLCNRWSELSMLMPYIVMNNETEPQILTSNLDAGRFVKNNLDVRQRFRYYLDSAYREARANNQPFVYPVSMRYNDYMEQEFDNGVLIGETLFYAVVLEEPTGDLTVNMPPGNWFSNGGPTLGEYIVGEKEHTLTGTDLSNLLFLKVGNIFVLDDTDNPGYVIVRAYQMYIPSVKPITLTFNYYEDSSESPHQTAIELSTTDSQMSFTYTSNGESIVNDIKVSKIEIYLWDAETMTNELDWVAYNPRGDNKWNLEFDFIERETLGLGAPHSLFDDSWTQSMLSGQ